MKNDLLFVFALVSIAVTIPLLFDQVVDAYSTFFYADKTTYVKGDIILVSGSIGDYIHNALVTVQVFDNKNNLLLTATINPKPDGSFIARIPTNGTEWKTGGAYDVKAQYDNASYIGDSTFVFYADQLPPLKQTEEGIPFWDIKCDSGLVEIMKQEDGSIACVNPNSIPKLISLNWGYDPSEKLTVYGLKSVYKVGEEIDAKFRVKALGNPCSGPQILVRDSEQKIVWQANDTGVGLCGTSLLTQNYQSEAYLGSGKDTMGLLIITQPGEYSMNISWFDGNITKAFSVIPNDNTASANN